MAGVIGINSRGLVADGFLLCRKRGFMRAILGFVEVCKQKGSRFPTFGESFALFAQADKWVDANEIGFGIRELIYVGIGTFSLKGVFLGCLNS